MTTEQRIIALAQAIGLDIKNINVTIGNIGVGVVITSGTTPPNGGNDGDIYLQYT